MIAASLTHALKNDPATQASWRQAKRVTLTSGAACGSAIAAPATSGAASVTTGAAPLMLVDAPAITTPAPVVHGAATTTATPEIAAA